MTDVRGKLGFHLRHGNKLGVGRFPLTQGLGQPQHGLIDGVNLPQVRTAEAQLAVRAAQLRQRRRRHARRRNNLMLNCDPCQYK